MAESARLSETIDRKNHRFTSHFKKRLKDLSRIPDSAIEWLIMEHYQFSFANKGLLQAAIETTKKLGERGVSAELQRNVDEEDGHAPMYKRGMLAAGTDVDARVEFAPTTRFLARVSDLTTGSPSRALGALYATETAAIFEHEMFFDVCHEICKRRGAQWEGSVIKHFHDIHLSGGVEQSHKDGLAVFVDLEEDPSQPAAGERIVRSEVLEGAEAAIDAMHEWWTTLVDRVMSAATADRSSQTTLPTHA